MALQFDEIKTAQSGSGFNLANAAQAATLPIATSSPSVQPSGLQMPAGYAASSPVITPESLQTPTPITLPQPVNDQTATNGMIAGATQTSKSITDYIKELTPPVTAEQTQSDTLSKQLMDLVGQDTGKASALSTAETAAGLPDLKKQLSDINGQITVKNADYNAAFNSLENTPQQIASVVGSKQQQLQRTQASEIGMLTARAQALQGNITLAQDTAAKAVDLQYSAIEDQIAVKQAQLKILEPILTKQEKVQADALNRKYEEQKIAIAEQKANQKAIQEMILNAAAQQAPADLVNAASKATTPLEATKILGKYSGDFLKYEMLKEQIKTEGLQQAKIKADTAKTYADINKIKSDLSSNNPNIDPKQAGKYAGALSVILGSDKFTKEQKAAVTNAINNGQDPFAVIKNNAKNIMGQSAATDLQKAEVATSQLNSIDTLLKDYYKSGGKTGLFDGNYEKVINNLGKVNNPKLVGISTQIALAMQEYRLAVTGTAASVKEDARIDNVFPGINNSQGLNQARTNALKSSFQSKIDAAYRTVLGSTYDDIKNLNVSSVDPANNPFTKALGSSTGNNFTGTSIIGGVNSNGTFNFVIPK